MFIGHYAVAFAGKKAAPEAPLPVLLLAALFADILWPILVAVGAEQVRIVPGITAYTPLDLANYPWSHSLLMLVIWGALFAAFYRNRPNGRRVGLVLGALVVSHWVLDWITHRPDMPLYPGGPEYGLGLWNNIPATMIVEIGLFAAGIYLYASVTRPRDAIGRWGFGSLAALLFVAFIVDALTPTPPPSVKFIWVAALIATAVTLLWAAWVDRHRKLRQGNERQVHVYL